MLKEFKEFALKGSVVDLAVGVIIGAAFGKIVTSLVDNIINPILGLIVGRVSFANLFITVSTAKIGIGLFLNDIINFVLIAFVIFIMVKQINRMRRKEEAKAPGKSCPFCFSEVNPAATRCPQCTSELHS